MSVPETDPSRLSTDAIDRAVKAERDFVIGQIGILAIRLDAMDKATEVLLEQVTRTPTEIQREVTHLRELMTQMVSGVEEKTGLAHDASEKAIEKAEEANKERVADLARRVDELAEKVGKL